MAREAEFIEHVFNDQVYVTDIWYHPDSGRYHSVLTDLWQKDGFDTIEAIKADVDDFIKEAHNNGKEKEQSKENE